MTIFRINIIILSILTILNLGGCVHLKLVTKRDIKELSPYQSRLSEIQKSTILIKTTSGINKNKTGSGTLIQDPFFGSYILTNAHICLDDFPFFIHNKKYKKKFLKQKSSYLIINKKRNVSIEINNTDLSYILENDLCRIPVSESSFDSSFAFLSKKSRISLPRQPSKKVSLFLFTRNASTNKEVIMKKGVEIRSADYVYINQKSKTANKKLGNYTGPVSYTSINIVPGDSGSLIYDQNLNIYGLAFGNNVTDTEVLSLGRKKSRSDIDFSFFKELLIFYGLTKEDLAQQKIELKGLEGMFIKLEAITTDNFFNY